VILVRHASAGDASRWQGHDRVRPLDDVGRRQAEKLVGALDGFEVARVLSSPYIRCLQTVEPLAAARGLTVELCDELADTRQAEDGVALVRSLADDPVVACVHGGLSEAVFGPEWSQRKAGVLVVGFGPRVLAQLDAAV
jgi:8-oxo-dGTP diphosphatase